MPEVPITTPKPLEVNLNMRLDVYQYRGDEPADKESGRALDEANTRMRNRMAEIFNFKSHELVGENHRGLLEIRQVPAGKWGDDVKRQVSAENEDRMLFMRQKAKDSGRTLQEVQDEQWKIRTRQANGFVLAKSQPSQRILLINLQRKRESLPKQRQRPKWVEEKRSIGPLA
jgi:hypothetical protein